MYDQSVSPLRKPIPYEPHRNYIVNGDMRISQRGDYTSNPVVIANGYYLDRLRANVWSSATGTVQRVSSSIGVSGYALRIQSSSANSGALGIILKQEVEPYFLGNTHTFSCDVRTNRSDVRLHLYDVAPYQLNIANSITNDETWQKLVATVKISSSATQVRFDVNMSGPGGENVSFSSGDYFEVANIKLEAGVLATPLIPRLFGEELALCQRYYEKSYNLDTPPNTATPQGQMGQVIQTNENTYIFETTRFAVEKRIVPTMVVYNANVAAGPGTVWNSLAGNLTECGYHTSYIGTTSATFLAHSPTVTVGSRTQWHWTAEAEL